MTWDNGTWAWLSQSTLEAASIFFFKSVFEVARKTVGSVVAKQKLGCRRISKKLW